MTSTFAASIDAWSEKARRNLLLIAQQSAQDLADEVTEPIAKGGRVPVDTGFLRNSLQGSLTEMPRINPAATNSDRRDVAFTLQNTVSAIVGAQMGDTIYLGFTAAYAGIMEDRYGFVADAALSWDRIVQENARKVR